MCKPARISEKDNKGRDFMKVWHHNAQSRDEQNTKYAKLNIFPLTDFSLNYFNLTESFGSHTTSVTLSLVLPTLIDLVRSLLLCAYQVKTKIHFFIQVADR